MESLWADGCVASQAGRELGPITFSMAKPHIIVMSGGGVRGLVALALFRDEQPEARLSIAHVVDGRDASAQRRDHVRKQASTFNGKLIEISARTIYGHGRGLGLDGEPRGHLAWPRTLLEVVGEAGFNGAKRVVWPVAVNADARLMAQATEQAMLCEQMVFAGLDEPDIEPRDSETSLADETSEDDAGIRIELPLIDMSDQQVIDLGNRLDVDWENAWWCWRAGAAACGTCGGCQRWRKAFDRKGAGLTLQGASAK